MGYDEDAAIAYIRQNLPPASVGQFDDDEILNVIDIIWDYYDDNGFLDIEADVDDDDELNTADLIAYVKKIIAKDPASPLSTADIEAIVKLELDYEDSIEI